MKQEEIKSLTSFWKTKLVTAVFTLQTPVVEKAGDGSFALQVKLAVASVWSRPMQIVRAPVQDSLVAQSYLI